mgnify:CR=1 FL=1
MQRGRRFDFPLASPLAFVVVTVAALLAAAFPLTGSPGPEAAQLLSAVEQLCGAGSVTLR